MPQKAKHNIDYYNHLYKLVVKPVQYVESICHEFHICIVVISKFHGMYFYSKQILNKIE